MQPGDDFYPFGTVVAAPGQSSKPNDSNVQFEAVTVGERSIACQINHGQVGAVRGVMIAVMANGNPGAAEIDVQDAAVDSDGSYLTQTGSAAYKITVWTQLGGGANWIGTTELVPEAGRFISLKVVANPNAVSFWAKLSVI